MQKYSFAKRQALTGHLSSPYEAWVEHTSPTARDIDDRAYRGHCHVCQTEHSLGRTAESIALQTH